MTAIATAVKIPALSQSRFELMACPELYLERIVRGHEMPSSQPAERGTEIHASLHAYVNHLVAERKARDLSRFDLLTAPIVGEAREILDGMREGFQIDPEHVLGTEMYLALDEDLEPLLDEAEWGGSGAPAAYEGTPDLVICPSRTEIECRDYKSYYQIIKADTFQAKLYPLLLFKHFPDVQTVRFVLDFVRYGTSRDVQYSRVSDLPKLEAAARSARSRQKKLHGITDGKAMPGSHCCYCPLLRHGCPIAEINPYVEQSPEDRLRFALWLRAANKENTRILQDFARVAPVTVTDGNGNIAAASYDLSEKAKYPLVEASATLDRWAIENGECLDGRLFIGATELKPLLKAKKRAELAQAMERVKVTVRGTKFAISGMDEEDEGTHED